MTSTIVVMLADCDGGVALVERVVGLGSGVLSSVLGFITGLFVRREQVLLFPRGQRNLFFSLPRVDREMGGDCRCIAGCCFFV
jgi:hypothetical protein